MTMDRLTGDESRYACPLPPGLLTWVARRKGRGTVAATLPAVHATEFDTGCCLLSQRFTAADARPSGLAPEARAARRAGGVAPAL
jgi:hypothetical protein